MRASVPLTPLSTYSRFLNFNTSVTSAKGLRRGKFPRELRKKWNFPANLKRYFSNSGDFRRFQAEILTRTAGRLILALDTHI
jgi:hypothetical protein